MKQKNSKWPTQKNWVFQPPPKAEQFSPKFHKLVLGWIGSIDAKGIHFTQPIGASGCLTEAQFTPKNLSLHRTAWQPHRLSKMDALRINWSYSPKDQFVKFWQKLLSFWWWLKNSVFLSRPFWNFFLKFFYFVLNLYKLVTIYGVPRIFQNFDDYPDFQQKARGV